MCGKFGIQETKSESEMCGLTSTQYEKYMQQIVFDGSPNLRRTLAAMEQNSTTPTPDALWQQMLQSVVAREKSLDGVYALHISKSGGTSLCDAMKADRCFVTPDKRIKAFCWAGRYKSKSIDLGTKWARRRKVNETNIQFKNWVFYDENSSPSSTCSDVRAFLQKRNQSLAMSENWLPNGGVCEHDFMNIILLRHPLERLLSHYRHLYYECVHHSPPDSCTSMLTEDGYFDIDFMNKTFDIVTDNYNVRSLNEQYVYKEPTGFNGKGDDYLAAAMANLNKFDWVLLLTPGEETTLNQTNMLMREGIGLSHSLPVSRKRSGRAKKLRWSREDEERLMQMNSLDLKVWEEAKRLHKLDVVSVKRMREASMHLWEKRGSSKCMGGERCCGVIKTCQYHN